MSNNPVRLVRKIAGIISNAYNRVILEDENGGLINGANPLPIQTPSGIPANVQLVDNTDTALKLIDRKLRTSSMPYGYDIVEGNVADHGHVLINASVLGAGATWADMWGGSPAIPNAPLLTGAITMEAVGGAQDTVVGTGISQIEIHYIDGNGDVQEQIVTLTGAVAVPLTGTILHINTVHAVAAGAGATAPYATSANIDIQATGGGTVYARIPVGEITAPRMVFRIPADATGYWVDLMAFVLALSNNSDALLQIVSNVNTSDFTLLPQGMWMPHWTIGGGSTGANAEASLSFPFKFPTGAIVKCRVRRVSGAGNADGFITGSGWIEY